MDDLSSSYAVSPAWARVRILLNMGRRSQATCEALEAFASLSFRDEDLLRAGGPLIYGMEDLPVGWAFMHPVRNMILLNLTVANQHTFTPGFHRFGDQITQLRRPAFRHYEIGDFARLSNG